MTEQKKVEARTATPVHENVHTALAAAQSEMGALIKGEVNPHFKSRYADLADVVAACREPFTQNGICFHHKTERAEGEWVMVTVLTHGTSGTEISCAVPLIVQKNDMQGFKSATTYAKRIGLESVSGLAPEDDDGNDAAKAAPKRQEQQKSPPKPEMTPEQKRDGLKNLILERPTTPEQVDQLANGPKFSAAFDSLPEAMQAELVRAMTDKKAELTTALLGDEIPY